MKDKKSEIIVPLQSKQIANISKQESNTILQLIERAATNPDVDIDKMERLMVMKERMDKQQAEILFNQAMTAAQSEMEQVGVDTINKQTTSFYASYSALDKKLRPIYTKHGFSLSFDTDDCPTPDWVRIVCIVSHLGGFSRSPHLDLPADGKGAKGGDVMTKTHATGSAMTYGMRYLLKLVFNVAVGEDDNDGNDPIEYITEEQAANLLDRITEIGANKEAFLKVCKVEKLSQLPAARFEGALKRLEQRR